MVVGGILLAVIFWVYLPLAREPKYEGKRLSFWFREYCRSGQSIGYDWSLHRESAAALQQMGTNAVPYLLQQAFCMRQDSATKSNFYRFVNDSPRSWGLPWLLNSEMRRGEAPFALKEIKPPAAQLLSLMHKQLKSANHFERCQTLFILGTAGDGAEEVIPNLTSALQDTNRWARRIAIQSLDWIGPRADAAVPGLIEVLKEPIGTNQFSLGSSAAIALGKIGSASAPAVPLIRKLFEQEKNWNLRCSLASALFRIDPGQADALAFLTNGVTSHQPASDRWIAASQLGEIGPDAKAAVPVLLEALEGTNDMLHSQIPGTLKKMGMPTETFLPAMKKNLASKNETTRANTAARILEIDPADHEAHLALMAIIEHGSLFQDFAINTLGGAGPAAQEAVPVLRKVAKSNSQGERDRVQAAVRALKRIEAKK